MLLAHCFLDIHYTISIKFASKNEIARVREGCSIFDIVSNFVELKNSGIGTKKGLCPFHSEKSPSFTVRETTNTFHCFGCGEGGDIFTFIMKINGVEFYEALEYVASKSGMTIKWEERNSNSYHSNSNKSEEVSRSRIIEINNFAMKVFQENIESDEAKIARQMLHDRNFTKADCNSFNVGYAMKSQDFLIRKLSQKGFSTNELIASGIASGNNSFLRDRFQGRVIWPIIDVSGDVLGFGARKLYEDDYFEAKYLNTAETRVYKKSKVLYGINKARQNISSKREVVIVEGYTDVMAMHLAGVDTAVATCGTAFGSEHALYLKRLMGDTDPKDLLMRSVPKEGGRIIFTFDGDSAGLKAAWRSFEFVQDFLVQSFVAIAPDNLDPCDLRIKHGDLALNELVNNAKPMIKFMIDSTLQEFNLNTNEGVSQAVDSASKIIANVPNPIVSDGYIRDLSQQTGVAVNAIFKIVQEYRNIKYAQTNKLDNYNEVLNNSAKINVQNSSFRKKNNSDIEKNYIATLLQYPKLIDTEDFFIISPEMINNNFLRDVYNAIENSGGIDQAKIMHLANWVSEIKSHFKEDNQKFIDILTNLDIEIHDEKKIRSYFVQLSNRIKINYLTSEKKRLTQIIQRSGSDYKSNIETHNKIMELEKEIRKIL